MADYALHSESKAQPINKSSPVHYKSQPQAVAGPHPTHHSATVAQGRPCSPILSVDANEATTQQDHVDLKGPVKDGLSGGIVDETANPSKQETSKTHAMDVKKKEDMGRPTSAGAAEASSKLATTLGKRSMDQADLTADIKGYKRNRGDKDDTTAGGPSTTMDSTMRQVALGGAQGQNDHKRPLGEQHESPHTKKTKTSPSAKTTSTAPEPKSRVLGDFTNFMSRASGVKPGRTGLRKERVSKLAEALGANTMSDMARLRNEQESVRQTRMKEGRKPAYPVDDKDHDEEKDDKQEKQRKERPRAKAGKGKRTRDMVVKENDPKGVKPRQFQDRVASERKTKTLREKEDKEETMAFEPEDKKPKSNADFQRLRALTEVYIPNHSFLNHRAPGHRNVEQPQKTTARTQLDKGADKENLADKVDKADKADKKAPVPKPFTLDEILQKTKIYNQGLYRK